MDEFKLGPLTIINTYEFYDEPVFFLCHDNDYQLYIGLLVNDDTEKKVWFYMPITRERVEQIEREQPEPIQMFQESESGYVYCAILFKDGIRPNKYNWINVSTHQPVDYPISTSKLILK